MGCDAQVVDSVWFLVLSIATIGLVSALLLVGVIVVFNLDLIPLDSSVLVWLIVALCISVTVLICALYLQFCLWKYGRLVLAILYTIFDFFLLLAGIVILVWHKSVVNYLGGLWVTDGNGAIVQYIEQKLNCCGFDTDPEDRDCNGRISRCSLVLEDTLGKYGTIIGSIFIVFFVLLLVGVVMSYIRALAQPHVREVLELPSGSTEIKDELTGDSTVWF
jgi:hypothetical protein